LVKDSAALRFDIQQQRFTNQYGLLFLLLRSTNWSAAAAFNFLQFFQGDDEPRAHNGRVGNSSIRANGCRRGQRGKN
jgi:hypothetical protein